DARSLFSLECFDGHRPKFYSFHRLPRLLIALQDLHAVKSRGSKGRDETLLGERARDTTAPKLRIVLQALGHFFIAHDVGDNGAATYLKDAEDFVEELPLGICLDQIKDAVGNDNVDRIARDKRILN